MHASTGAGITTVERKGRNARKEFFLESLFAGLAVFAFIVVPATPKLAFSSGERRRVFSQSAPPAAIAFKSTPIHVVPRRPRAGISQNPAAIAPTAAPAVFAAYSRPVSPASQFAAIGNVAPIAAAGTPSSARLIATRTSAKRAGAAPSA